VKDRVRARIALTIWDLDHRRPRRIAIGDLLDADDPVVLAAPEHFVAISA
jgi:hypothetical protein